MVINVLLVIGMLIVVVFVLDCYYCMGVILLFVNVFVVFVSDK